MRSIFYTLIVCVSFSCMLYELVLAQTSSLLLGNALINYSVTICIYLAALGVGSLLFKYLKRLNSSLLITELVLSYLGTLAPIAAILADYGFRQALDVGGANYHLANQAFVYGLIALVGILSGLELPILISLGESLFELRSGTTLGLDYLGTLMAVCIFPTIGMQGLGLFGTAALAGLGSWVGAALTLYSLPKKDWSNWHIVLLIPSLVIVLVLLGFEHSIREFISSSIYLAGNR